MTFVAWLLRHVERQSPLGDLARDTAQDVRDGWDRGDGSADTLRVRMESLGACYAALETLVRARHSYAGYVRTHRA